MSERKALFTRAKELKLDLPGNISNDNLKAAIAAAEGRAGGTTAPPKDDAEKVSARVLSELKYNGETYAPDTETDTVELTPAEFKTLEGLKVVQALDSE
ncbi:hypothetical protein K3555_12015 [Leisingera sp. M527]|uniref:hypothetical protein n=1 Tax=Leisingera sp. M527 TaxID=2867014 RepID=UPI0021A85813|nr:hypothetical protein [Leisingera sp. M527]UWQ31336.1 hypothetical protein K3555_12015 [Leisingera sp. M527]